jgi:hypothetical protein
LDDRDATIQYFGNAIPTDLEEADAGTLMGIQGVAYAPRQRATFIFVGTKFKIGYFSYSNSPQMSIVIDGGAPVLFNTNSPGNETTGEWESPELTDEKHTVEIKNEDTAAINLWLDYIDFLGSIIPTHPATVLLDDRDPVIWYAKLNYAQPAATGSLSNAHAGTYTYLWSLSALHATIATFTFIGTKVRIGYLSYSNVNQAGNMKVVIDEGAPVSASSYATQSDRILEWESAELTYGMHTVQIYCDDTNNYFLRLDYIELTGEGNTAPLVPTVTRVDDTSELIQWNTELQWRYTGYAPAYLGTYNTMQPEGFTVATFAFTGTRVRVGVLGTTDNAKRGAATIVIDGGAPIFYTPLAITGQHVWESELLEYGTHTIEIRCDDPAGKYVYFDFIEYEALS